MACCKRVSMSTLLRPAWAIAAGCHASPANNASASIAGMRLTMV